MNNQEAIEVIKLALSQVEWDYPMDYATAFDMAIFALQTQDLQPTCNQLATDVVSRQAAIDAIDKALSRTFAEPCGEMILKDVPSAQPDQREDAVSRKDAIIQLSHNKNGDPDCDVIIQHDIETLKQLSPVTPKRKTGKWVNNIHDLPICDQCGYMTPYDRAVDDYEYGNFCPNCGAKMNGGEQE